MGREITGCSVEFCDKYGRRLDCVSTLNYMGRIGYPGPDQYVKDNHGYLIAGALRFPAVDPSGILRRYIMSVICQPGRRAEPMTCRNICEPATSSRTREIPESAKGDILSIENGGPIALDGSFSTCVRCRPSTGAQRRSQIDPPRFLSTSWWISAADRSVNQPKGGNSPCRKILKEHMICEGLLGPRISAIFAFAL